MELEAGLFPPLDDEPRLLYLDCPPNLDLPKAIESPWGWTPDPRFATKKIPADFKIKWYSINWKNMAGMRDRLIHDYMGINYSIVWDVVRNKIPELSEQIAEVIRNEQKTTGNTL